MARRAKIANTNPIDPMQTDDAKRFYRLWTDMKANRQRYVGVWNDIEKYVGITVDPDYMWSVNQAKAGATLDTFIDDPTSTTCVNQFGDYLTGIMWGTGDGVLDIVPSRDVLEFSHASELDDYYKFVTEQVLYHMNHPLGGFHTALKPYAYDQAAFGTSGIGVFKNDAFKSGIEDNALLFRSFGIDNMCIDEGKSGLPDYVGISYKWKASRVVSELCMKDGAPDTGKIARLPKALKEAYEKQSDDEFNLVCLIVPRADFDPKLAGKRGTRFRGVWMMDEGSDNKIFHEEDFTEHPIPVARMIKVRGQIYGRSSGTQLLSTIRSVNFMVGTSIEIIDKMSNPALGMMNTALFGDNALDTSPNALTIFNPAMMGSNGEPIFPIHDVGDPSGIIQFLIPYLNEKVVTAFKIDALLDFSSAKDMTATESLQRYAIRGKSLSGILQQQKVELLVRLVRASVANLWQMGELGIDGKIESTRAKVAVEVGQQRRVIPEGVKLAMERGKPWFEIKFNNELEKLTRTEKVQNLVQLLQTIGGIASLKPEIVEAVDWHKMVSEINDSLDFNNQIIISADDYKKKLAAQAEAQAAAAQAQGALAGSEVSRNMASANKTNAEAQNARNI